MPLQAPASDVAKELWFPTMLQRFRLCLHSHFPHPPPPPGHSQVLLPRTHTTLLLLVFPPPNLFDLGSNPHLTPRYSQGAVALSHQLASASSHPSDVIQSAIFLPSFRTTTHSFGQLASASSSDIHRQTGHSSNAAAQHLGHRAKHTSTVMSNERMPQWAHAAHTSIPSQAKRLSTRQRSAVLTRQHEQCRVADWASHSDRALHGMQRAAAGKCHLCSVL